MKRDADQNTVKGPVRSNRPTPGYATNKTRRGKSSSMSAGFPNCGVANYCQFATSLSIFRATAARLQTPVLFRWRGAITPVFGTELFELRRQTASTCKNPRRIRLYTCSTFDLSRGQLRVRGLLRLDVEVA